MNNETEPTLNPYSFNEYANMLYIDQPIGVGFSYGNDTVTSTVTAAPFVWNLLQAFFAQFPQYETRDFGIFTESYGGHYGPEFAYYIEQQNTGIDNGTIDGDKINLIALGINNGWYNLTIQEKAAIDFASNNSYRALIDEATAEKLYTAYDNVCLPAIEKCTATGTNAACIAADSACEGSIDNVIYNSADFDPYDIRSGSNDPNPPETYTTYLARADVRKAIGAASTYKECANKPGLLFSLTGDGMCLRDTLLLMSDADNDSLSLQMLDLSSRPSPRSYRVASRCSPGQATLITSAIGLAPLAWQTRWTIRVTMSSPPRTWRPTRSMEPSWDSSRQSTTSPSSGSMRLDMKSPFTVCLARFLFIFISRKIDMTVTNTITEPELALQVFTQTMQGKAISST